MKKLSACAVLLLLLNSLLFGQTPGFKGKKFASDFGVAYFPAFSGPTSVTGKASRQGLHLNFYGFNWRVHAGIEYTIGRKWSFGIDGSYTRTALSSYSLYKNDFKVNERRNARIDAGTIGIKFRRFLGSHFAPIGMFYVLESGAMFIRTEDSQNLFYTPNSQYRIDNAITAYVGIGVGRKYNIFKSLTIGYEIAFRIIIPTQLRLNKTSEFLPSSSYELEITGTEKHPMTANAYDRLFTQQMLNIKFTIGLIY